MTAATSQPSAKQANATSEDFADVPVLLRLPDFNRSATRQRVDTMEPAPINDREQDIAASDEQTASSRRGSRTEGRSGAGQRETSQPSTVSASNSQPAAGGSKTLSLLWRLGIVAAAIGLVVLAYRIINGPPATGDDVPAGTFTVVPAEDQIESETPATPQAPTIAPTELAAEPEGSPAVAMPDPITESQPEAPLAGDKPSHSELPITDHPMGDSHGYADTGSEAVNQHHRAGDAPSPSWNSQAGDSSRPWNDTVDSYESTHDPYSTTYDSFGTESNPYAAPTQPHTQPQPRSDTAFDQQPTQNFQTNPYVERGVPHQRQPQPTYQQTDPRNWRTADQWNPPAEQPTYQYDRTDGSRQQIPVWERDSRSAARLQPEIHQPPLNR